MLKISCISVIMPENLNGLSFFSRRKNNKIKEETENEYSNLLCRFVRTGTGKRIGESVSIDNDIIIIKSGKKFLGVPLKHIEEKEKILIVKGLIDFNKAYKMGEKWRKNSFRKIKNKEDEKGI